VIAQKNWLVRLYPAKEAQSVECSNACLQSTKNGRSFPGPPTNSCPAPRRRSHRIAGPWEHEQCCFLIVEVRQPSKLLFQPSNQDPNIDLKARHNPRPSNRTAIQHFLRVQPRITRCHHWESREVSTLTL
jgi:hypothetical protein